MDEKEKTRQFGFGRFSEYRNFIAYVVGGASLGFRKEDHAPEMTTDQAFADLRRGLPVAFDRIKDKAAISEATALLDASEDAFRKGEVHAGAHLLWDFDEKLLELRRGGPKKRG